MNDFETYIYNVVKELQDKCVAEGRVPVSVSLNDIMERINVDIKQTLNGFVKNGKMAWYPNLNKIPMFTIKD